MCGPHRQNPGDGDEAFRMPCQSPLLGGPCVLEGPPLMTTIVPVMRDHREGARTRFMFNMGLG